MELTIAIVLLSLLLWSLSRHMPISFFSPVYALVAIYVLIFGAGGFSYDRAYGGGGADLTVSARDCFSLAVNVAWLMCAFTAGALAFRAVARRGWQRKALLISPTTSSLSALQVQSALLFAIVALALVAAGHGVENIYERTQYLTETNHIVRIVGGALLPPAVLGLGAASTSRNALYRAAAIALASTALLLALAICTRFFCFVPALFFAGGLFIKRKQRFLKFALVTTIAIAPLLIIVPLTGREMRKQGLSTLPDLFDQLLALNLEASLHTVVNNIFISEPITIVSMQSPVSDSIGYVETGVSPLPGFMTNWEASQRRINDATPFNAVGDLLRAGLLVGLGYFAVIGFYFAHIDQRIRKSGKINAAILGLMALSYLFIVVTLQYPLRNSTRLIYYMVGFEALIGLWRSKTSTHPIGRDPYRPHASPFLGSQR